MIKIRTANPDDWVDISIMLQEFHVELYENIPEMMEVYSKIKTVLYNLQMAESKNPFITYLAFDNDELIGMASGKVHTHNWMRTLWGTEDYWFVKKEYRNGKDSVGIKLFNKLINWFEANGAEKICMSRFTFADNIDSFYKKKGFTPYEIAYVKNVNVKDTLK